MVLFIYNVYVHNKHAMFKYNVDRPKKKKESMQFRAVRLNLVEEYSVLIRLKAFLVQTTHKNLANPVNIN